MRIAVIDENAARAAIIEQGLAEVGERDVFIISERKGMVQAIAKIEPDVILVDLGNPSRDMLEEYFAVSRAVAKPNQMMFQSPLRLMRVYLHILSMACPSVDLSPFLISLSVVSMLFQTCKPS